MPPEVPAVVATASILAAVAAVHAVIVQLRDEPTGVRAYESREGRGQQWLEDCRGDPQQIYSETRLQLPIFEELVNWLRLSELVSGENHIIAEKTLIYCYICAQGASWRNTQSRCGRSLDTISRYFHEVLRALLHLYKEVVHLPKLDEPVPSSILENPKRYPFFRDCIGALGGTQFCIHVPASEQRRYRNRHGKLSQNVFAAVNFEMDFIYVLPGWEGSAHDRRVLADAQLKGFCAPNGRYFLADAGYTNSELLLTPYHCVKYHLREIGQAGATPADKYELFNFRHSSLRNVVERTFGVFKRRWRIFDRPHEFSIQTQTRLIYAQCALHNFINRHQRDAVDADFEALGMYADEELEMAQRDAENERNLRAVERNMDERREAIAEEMWESYCIAKR